MKKLLGLLGAIGMVATTGSSVIACHENDYLAEATIATGKTSVEVEVKNASLKTGDTVTASNTKQAGVTGSGNATADGSVKMVIKVEATVDRTKALEVILDVNTTHAPAKAKAKADKAEAEEAKPVKIGQIKVTIEKNEAATPEKPAKPVTPPKPPVKPKSL